MPGTEPVQYVMRSCVVLTRAVCPRILYAAVGFAVLTSAMCSSGTEYAMGCAPYNRQCSTDRGAFPFVLWKLELESLDRRGGGEEGAAGAHVQVVLPSIFLCDVRYRPREVPYLAMSCPLWSYAIPAILLCGAR
eukprot:3007939-Rhodomonas_salina.1